MIDIKRLKEEILRIIRAEGPLVPVQISRKLGKDTIFAGAVLSELAKEKQVKVSNAKLGGSPVYYVSGQENKLNVLYTHLPGKEKEAYELLRKNQVLMDKECEPAIRIALRSIPDFAFPLEEKGELYWRWYLLAEEEARKILQPQKIHDLVPVVLSTKEIARKESMLDIKKERVGESALTLKKHDAGDDFLQFVHNYLNDKHIRILELYSARRKRETHGKVYVNSDLGVLEYFCIAKNKKSISDADLSLANDLGRKHKLPVLFLSNGNLTKKSEKYLNENLKGRIIFRKV